MSILSLGSSFSLKTTLLLFIMMIGTAYSSFSNDMSSDLGGDNSYAHMSRTLLSPMLFKEFNPNRKEIRTHLLIVEDDTGKTEKAYIDFVSTNLGFYDVRIRKSCDISIDKYSTYSMKVGYCYLGFVHTLSDPLIEQIADFIVRKFEGNKPVRIHMGNFPVFHPCAREVVPERHLASSCPHKKDQEIKCTNHINQRNHKKNKRYKQRRALYLNTVSKAKQEIDDLRSVISIKTNYLMSFLSPETLHIALFKSDYDIGNYFFIQHSFLINNQKFEMENVNFQDLIPQGTCYQFKILDTDSETEETSESIESFSNPST